MMFFVSVNAQNSNLSILLTKVNKQGVPAILDGLILIKEIKISEDRITVAYDLKNNPMWIIYNNGEVLYSDGIGPNKAVLDGKVDQVIFNKNKKPLWVKKLENNLEAFSITSDVKEKAEITSGLIENNITVLRIVIIQQDSVVIDVINFNDGSCTRVEGSDAQRINQKAQNAFLEKIKIFL